MRAIILIYIIVTLLVSAQWCKYDEATSTVYTVYYCLKDTTTDLADSKAVTDHIVGDEVIESAILIDGYTVDSKIKRLILEANSSRNVIKFYYTIDIDNELLIPITTKDIENFFNMTKNEVIKQLGENYKLVHTGAEGTYEGYYYERYGLTFIFEYNDAVIGIEGSEKYCINGASPGMRFEQIQEHLGPSKIIETWIGNPELFGNPDFATYMIEYRIGKCKYSFYSLEHNGNDSWLSIIMDN